MDKCGIGTLTGTECGSISLKGCEVSEFQSLNACQRDVTGHLKMLNLCREGISSEKELILLRAGIFEGFAAANFMVCPKHRQSFGIEWRGRKKNCPVPASVASHRFKKHTGDRSVNKEMSEKIFHLTGLVIPIGS
ncbi:Hypothetical predicted protein, partial [Paramuricea clavata]